MEAIYIYPKTKERLAKALKDIPVSGEEDLLQAVLSMIEQGFARVEFDGNTLILTVPSIGMLGVFRPE